MPRFDGTGPAGQGQMTGRGLGPCGVGSGRGYFMGRGCFGCRRFVSPKNELIALEEEEAILKEELEDIKQEIAELKASKK